MGLKKILIITSSVDDTVSYVTEKYSGIANFFRVNVDKFSEYRFYIRNNGWNIADRHSVVDSENIYSIYYRKPMLPDLGSFDPQYHVLIQRDIISVINGIVDSFHGKVITKPSILRKTENKVFQMIYVNKQGWNIPKSYSMLDGIEDIYCLDKYDRFAKQKEWRVCWLPSELNYEAKILHVGSLEDIIDIVPTKDIRRYLLKKYSGYVPGIITNTRRTIAGTESYGAFKGRMRDIDGTGEFVVEIG